MLDDRKSDVLKALVEEHIRTGEPVSSQTVLSLSGLEVSSSTIRNDLCQLESYGFVVQPHTSSGRIPTHHGYRFYVDHLSPTRLRETTRRQIDAFFQQVHSQISEVLRETSNLVSDLTAYPAVVVGPAVTNEIVKECFGLTHFPLIRIRYRVRLQSRYISKVFLGKREARKSSTRCFLLPCILARIVMVGLRFSDISGVFNDAAVYPVPAAGALSIDHPVSPSRFFASDSTVNFAPRTSRPGAPSPIEPMTDPSFVPDCLAGQSLYRHFGGVCLCLY